MIDHALAAELDALAGAIARMRPPQNHNPHAFHEDRSELASQARALALRARTGEPPTVAADVPAPIGRQATFVESKLVNGRVLTVVTRRQQELVAAHNAAPVLG